MCSNDGVTYLSDVGIDNSEGGLSYVSDVGTFSVDGAEDWRGDGGSGGGGVWRRRRLFGADVGGNGLPNVNVVVRISSSSASTLLSLVSILHNTVETARATPSIPLTKTL